MTQYLHDYDVADKSNILFLKLYLIHSKMRRYLNTQIG